MEFAGPDVDAWVFDLTAPDDDVRARALARHQGLVARSSDAVHWSNRVWNKAGTPAPTEPHLVAEMDQARADFRWHQNQTIFGYLDLFQEADPQDTAVRVVYWPFVSLYLRWETQYPDDWRSEEVNLWSPWGRKEALLDHLGRRGVPDGVRPDAADLVLAAIQRPYRCKDWMYALLVRHTGAGFREQVLTAAVDPLRAGFILHLIDHPELRVTRKTWRRWLEQQR